jgi:hypothetical protein
MQLSSMNIVILQFILFLCFFSHMLQRYQTSAWRNGLPLPGTPTLRDKLLAQRVMLLLSMFVMVISCILQTWMSLCSDYMHYFDNLDSTVVYVI